MLGPPLILLTFGYSQYATVSPGSSQYATVSPGRAVSLPFSYEAGGASWLRLYVPAVENGVLALSASGQRVVCLVSHWTDGRGGPPSPAQDHCSTGVEARSERTDTSRLYFLMAYNNATLPSGNTFTITASVRLPGASSPPRNPPIASNGYCAMELSNLGVRCGREAVELCPRATDMELMQCLSAAAEGRGRERSVISPPCAYAMSDLSDCVYGPRMLMPMEIASFLLLVTASSILFCAILRCCCRFVCSPPPAERREAHGSRAESLIDTDSDREAAEEPPAEMSLVHLRAPSAGSSRAAAAAQASHKAGSQAPLEEAVEDDVPAYADVVDGAMLAPRVRSL